MPWNGGDGKRRPRPVPAVSARGESQVHELEGVEVRVGDTVDPRDALRDAGVPRVHLGRLGEPGGEAPGAKADVAEVGEPAVGVGRAGDVQPVRIEPSHLLWDRTQDVWPVGGCRRRWHGERVVEGILGRNCAVSAAVAKYFIEAAGASGSPLVGRGLPGGGRAQESEGGGLEHVLGDGVRSAGGLHQRRPSPVLLSCGRGILDGMTGLVHGGSGRRCQWRPNVPGWRRWRDVKFLH